MFDFDQINKISAINNNDSSLEQMPLLLSLSEAMYN